MRPSFARGLGKLEQPPVGLPNSDFCSVERPGIVPISSLRPVIISTAFRIVSKTHLKIIRLQYEEPVYLSSTA